MKSFSNFIDEFAKRNVEKTLRKEFFRILKVARKRRKDFLTKSDNPFWATNITYGKVIYLTDDLWIQPIAFKTYDKFRLVLASELSTNLQANLDEVLTLSNRQFAIYNKIIFTKTGKSVNQKALAPTQGQQINSNITFLVKFLARLLEEKEYKFDIF